LICADEFKPLTLTRRKRVPCMPGENIVDEPIDDPLINFKVNTYYVAIDIVLIPIQERFRDISTGLCIDLLVFFSTSSKRSCR